ncbi:MAG: hypothetical protein ACRDRO_18540 [Pseudonocardiaceae bacterium]
MTRSRAWSVYTGPWLRPSSLDDQIRAFVACSFMVTVHAGTWMVHLVLCNCQLSFGWVDA